MKRAFTLIELLVVIAIIAILAAILFPVFAQAKAAAKASAALSNAKQQTLACIQYSADSDDMFVIGQTNYPTSGAPSGSYNGLSSLNAVIPWTALVQPYSKNTDILTDPLATSQPTFTGLTKSDVNILFPHFGFNTWNLNTFNSVGFVPTSGTAPANPADTVLLASKYSYNDLGGYFQISAGTWGTYDGAFVNSPYPCGVPSFAWGKGNSYDGYFKSVDVGKYTSGDALRATRNMTVAFTDGHAAKRSPGAMAIKTPFVFDASGTNQSSYTVFSNYPPTTIDPGYLWDEQ